MSSRAAKRLRGPIGAAPAAPAAPKPAAPSAPTERPLTDVQRHMLDAMIQRRARIAAQRQSLALEDELAARYEADFGRELGMRPGDQLDTARGVIVRAHQPEAPPAPLSDEQRQAMLERAKAAAVAP